LIQKYDCLILGALGCGAFNNPPHEIAKIFCEICSIYAQNFKRIVFAVMSDACNDNCEIFQQTFLETFNDDMDGTMCTEHDPDVLYKDINEQYERTKRTCRHSRRIVRSDFPGTTFGDGSRLKTLGKYLIYKWYEGEDEGEDEDEEVELELDPALEMLKLAINGDVDPDDIDSCIWETFPDMIDDILGN